MLWSAWVAVTVMTSLLLAILSSALLATQTFTAFSHLRYIETSCHCVSDLTYACCILLLYMYSFIFFHTFGEKGGQQISCPSQFICKGLKSEKLLFRRFLHIKLDHICGEFFLQKSNEIPLEQALIEPFVFSKNVVFPFWT